MSDMVRTKSLRLTAGIVVVIAVAAVAYGSARRWSDAVANEAAGSAVPSARAAAGPAHSPSASPESTLVTTGSPVGYVASSACTQISFARAADGASARWSFSCRGLMSWEAWREGLRRSAVDRGWREVGSQSELLEFVNDDLRVAMTIDPRPLDGAFALIQRVLRS